MIDQIRTELRVFILNASYCSLLGLYMSHYSEGSILAKLLSCK